MFSTRAWKKTYDIERSLRQAKAARLSYKAMVGRGGGGASAAAAPGSLQLALVPGGVGAMPVDDEAGVQQGAAAGAAEAAAEEGTLALALVPAGQGLKRGRCQVLDDILKARQERLLAAQARALAQRGAGGHAALAAASSPPAKKSGGRPKLWVLRPDAPDFPTMEEYKMLNVSERNSLVPAYYDCASPPSSTFDHLVSD